jgi:hypothetical protein
MLNFEKYALKFKKVLDGSLFRDSMKGKWLFIMYLEFLTIIYIANRFWYEKIYMDTAKMRKEVMELKSESITVAAKLMEISRESQIEKQVKERGTNLQVTDCPPKQIFISEK